MKRFASKLLIFIAAVLTAPVALGQEWNIQLVDDAGDVGYDSQIAVLSTGIPYIAYVGGSGTLMLAWWVEQGGQTGWNFASIANASPGRAKEMLVDAQDRLHLAWCYGSYTYYGIYNPATQAWVLGPETVPLSIYMAHLDLALWSDGGNLIPIILGTAEGSAPAKIAKRDPGTGTWTVEICSGAYSAYGTASVAVAADGGLHVSFYEPSGANLVYGVKTAGGTTWMFQTIDTGGTVGQYSSILIDDVGDIHIAYYDGTNGDLKFASTTP